MFEVEEHIYFFYNHEENLLVDENGFRVYSIYEYITPNELLLFKHHQQDWAFLSRKGDMIVELIWGYYTY